MNSKTINRKKVYLLHKKKSQYYNIKKKVINKKI